MSKKSRAKQSSKQAKIHKIKAKTSVSPKKSPASSAKITKITAKVETKSTQAKVSPVKSSKTVTKLTAKPAKSQKATSLLAKVLKPLVLLLRYFKNSWLELKKVQWPTRKAAWAMVFAVVAYALFFLVLVLLLDNFFSYIFKLMLQ